ncbi:MAG: YciI family protein [Nitrospirota bacterium]
MKTVVIGESSGVSREAIMAVYPRHKAVVDRYIAQGSVVGIGPFTDGGNMAIFKTGEAAEAFSKEDPFILEGLVKSFVIKDWMDSMLPE